MGVCVALHRVAAPECVSLRSCVCSYCECFASGRLCGDNCNCAGCCNAHLDDPARTVAVQTTLDRNPNAFQPKIPQTETHHHEVTPPLPCPPSALL